MTESLLEFQLVNPVSTKHILYLREWRESRAVTRVRFALVAFRPIIPSHATFSRLHLKSLSQSSRRTFELDLPVLVRSRFNDHFWQGLKKTWTSFYSDARRAGQFLNSINWSINLLKGTPFSVIMNTVHPSHGWQWWELRTIIGFNCIMVKCLANSFLLAMRVLRKV